MSWVLVDTSVWIAVFRRREPLDLESVVPFDAVAMCPPVLQEVLQGSCDQRVRRLARRALLSLPRFGDPTPNDLWLEAAALYRTGRRVGLTVRSSVDCLIAAIAIRHGLEVLHDDRDFAALAAVSPLRQVSLQATPS